MVLTAVDWLCVVAANDRLMGIVIGVSISSGCIVICVIIILLRNRFDYNSVKTRGTHTQ